MVDIGISKAFGNISHEMLEAAKENKDEMQQKFIELGINRTILPECDWDFRQLAG